jgi:ABC-2 type transport system permease protein
VLLGNGPGVATLWARLPLLKMWLALLYALTTLALWHAPAYAWLLLVSAWARRATFLWAALPPIAICVVEKTAFNTTHAAFLLQDRLVGWLMRAFVFQPGQVPIDPLTALTPGRFLSAPGLWFGLAFAAACLAGAVRLRRYRGPI